MTRPNLSPRGGRPLSVRFSLTFEDYWSFNRYALLHTPWLPFYVAILLTIALGLMVNSAMQQSDPVTTFLQTFAGAAVVVGLIVGVVYYRNRGNARKLFYQNPQLAQPMTVTLDERGVQVQAAAGALDVEWARFKRIAQTGESIYLFYGLGMATIVPKRAFRSEDGAHEFYAYAREAWERAQGKSGAG